MTSIATATRSAAAPAGPSPLPHGHEAPGGDPALELEQLLGEDPDAARLRERATFDDAAGDRRDRLVLFGAGGLGRRVLEGLRAAGIEPLAFSDNRRELWGQHVGGLEVLSPEQVASRHGDEASFVVSIWGAGSPHRLEHSVAQLSALGCETVVPVAHLCWRHAEHLLPFYALDLPSKLLERRDDVERCFGLLADRASRREFVDQVRFRLGGDPRCLAPPVPGRQYLVHDVFEPRAGEVVVDCGAYDGDTLADFLVDRGPSFAHYVALEPDELNRRALEARVAALPEAVSAKVSVFPYAVGASTGTVAFDASGSLSSSLEGAAASGTVECIRLDDLAPKLDGLVPSFVKLDIEGAELDALAGGAEVLAAARPLLALASYHRQDHLWRVPLAAARLFDGYRLFLRPHNEQGWDLVCYAVPPQRVCSR